SGDDKVTGFHLADVFADLDDTPEILMAEYQKIKTHGRHAVLAVIDLAVGAARSDTKHLDKHSAAIGDITYGGLVDLDNMSGINLFWNNGKCFHSFLLCVITAPRSCDEAGLRTDDGNGQVAPVAIARIVLGFIPKTVNPGEIIYDLIVRSIKILEVTDLVQLPARFLGQHTQVAMSRSAHASPEAVVVPVAFDVKRNRKNCRVVVLRDVQEVGKRHSATAVNAVGHKDHGASPPRAFLVDDILKCVIEGVPDG